ncbi:hypothetical protein PAMP_006912 [Pampus punctatissimus]
MAMELDHRDREPCLSPAAFVNQVQYSNILEGRFKQLQGTGLGQHPPPPPFLFSAAAADDTERHNLKFSNFTAFRKAKKKQCLALLLEHGTSKVAAYHL